MNIKCSLCGKDMAEKATKEIGKQTYHMLYCENCKIQVARSD